MILINIHQDMLWETRAWSNYRRTEVLYRKMYINEGAQGSMEG